MAADEPYTINPVIAALNDCMDLHARHLNKRAEINDDTQALIDTIILADDIKKQHGTRRNMVARLRGQAMACAQRRLFVIAAYMDLIADNLDGKFKSQFLKG